MPAEGRSTVIRRVNVTAMVESVRMDAQMIRAATIAADRVFRENEKLLWASEGASGGTPWQQLTDDWLDFKKTSRKYRRLRNKAAGFGRANAPGKEALMSTRILVQYGAMRRAFSTQGDGHIAKGYPANSGGAKIDLGASGPKWWGYHKNGDPPNPVRDPIQRTAEQSQQMKQAVADAIRPILKRRMESAMRGGGGRA